MHAQGVCGRTGSSVYGSTLVGGVIKWARDFSLFTRCLRFAIEGVLGHGLLLALSVGSDILERASMSETI